LPREKAAKLRDVLTSLLALLRLAVLQRLGVFICTLAVLLTATSRASALEPAQTKTRVWGLTSRSITPPDCFELQAAESIREIGLREQPGG